MSTRVEKTDQGVEIIAQHHFQAPIQAVFDFFAEHENLRHVFGGEIRRTAAAPEGDNPNGLGSVRTIKIGPGPSFDERVEKFEPPHRIEYQITRGSPVKGHYGCMQFSQDGEGTRLDYSIRLASRIPGTTGLVGKLMARTLAKGLPRAERLIRAA